MRDALRRDAGVWLLLAVPALLPFARLSEAPLLIAAMFGIALLFRGALDVPRPALNLALLLFGAYWLPQFLSAFDSMDARKSWTEVGADLRFLPFLCFALHTVKDVRRARLLLAGMGLLVALWCLDALVQAATGWSLGGAARGDRLSGIFGDDNLKLGGVCAVLSPFLLLPALRRSGIPGLTLAFSSLLIVILLAGARAAWIGFAVACALVAWHQLGARRGTVMLAAALLLGILAGGIAHQASPRFAERVDRTAAALGGNVGELDHALAGRIPIWRTAVAMSLAHPLNGVGVRAFRHAYPAHAAPDDPWVDAQNGQGALHAHQWLLEVASETGAIGLLCWFAALTFALRAWRSASKAARAHAAAPGIALGAMLFPLNTHYAMYSSYWAVLLFVLVGAWIALLLGLRESAA